MSRADRPGTRQSTSLNCDESSVRAETLFVRHGRYPELITAFTRRINAVVTLRSNSVYVDLIA
jgi:hypothetical protein